MAADVRITMNTETFMALRALLEFDKTGNSQDFLAMLRSQGRDTSRVGSGDEWRPIIAEEATHHLQTR